MKKYFAGRAGASLRRKGRGVLSGLLCVMICLTAFCPFSETVFAQEQQTVRVGFFEMAGYHVQDEDGHRSGYGYEFLQKIRRYLPVRYEYVGYDKTWDEMLDMLEKGEIDILTAAAKTLEREARFEYSRSVVGINTALLTVKAGNTEIVSGDYSTYDGARIGLLYNSSKIVAFQSFADENHFSYEPVCYDSFSEMERALQTGDIDAIAGSNLRALKDEWVIDYFGQNTFYVMAPKGDRRILDEIDRAVELLDRNEPGWRTALMYNAYPGEVSESFVVQEEEQAYFDALRENHTVLKVLVNPDRQPYSFFEEGEAAGIFPSVFEKIAETMGFSYEYLDVKSSREYYDLLAAGAADIVIDMPFDYSNAEEWGYVLTDPYMQTGIAQLTSADFSGEVKKVAVKDYAILVRHYVEQYYPGVEIVSCDSTEECAAAVADGAADAAFLYNLTAQDILNHNYYNRFNAHVLDGNCIEVAMGVRQDCDRSLASALNRCINALHDTQISSLILQETADFQESVTLPEFLKSHPLYIAAMILVMVVLLMGTGTVWLSKRDAKRLRCLNEELAEANSARQEFVTKISHDMRTPMNAIMGFADMGKKQEDPEETRRCLDKISSSAEQLLALINDVLDLNRFERSSEPYVPTPTDLRAVTDSVSDIFRGVLHDRDLIFDVRQPEEECCVLTDGPRLQEILMNLLSNAVKFTEDGGSVTLSLDLLPEADQQHRIVQYTVSDTGCGISEEFLPHIYEYFTQEEKGARTSYKGTGLGLPIAKHYVEWMGGTIRVQSKKGQGTTFTVQLPVEIAEADAAAAVPQEAPSGTVLKGAHALLAEDNELNVEIATYMLEDAGMQITTAANGKEAVALFAENPPGTFDVILMDIMMPEMNGYEAAKAIRSMDDRPDGQTIPIIAMTANAMAEDIQASLDAGMNAHMAKPLMVEDVVRTIARYLKKS